MDPRCRVELFGELRLVQAGQITTRFRTQKAAAVLAYLALYIQQDHARERVLDLFWPEMDLDAARNNLSTLLVSLRRQLEPMGVPQGSVLIADRRNLRLNAAVVTTDVAEFDALLKAADRTSSSTDQRSADQGRLLEQAVALYRGDLLPGLYDDWALQERDRCRARYVDALVQWSRRLQAAGECETALAITQRAIAADPYREEVYASQMRLQAILGSPASALETYRQLEIFLKESLGVAPGGAARALAELLRSDPKALADVGAARPGVFRPVATRQAAETENVPRRSSAASLQRPAPAPPASQPAPSQPPPTLPLQMTRFFGRQQDLTQLERFLTDGFTRLLTLTGPGGTGKTRLAIEIARRVAPRFADRVWFVSLADLFEPSLVPFALASALSAPASARNEPLEASVMALGADPCLLILDNLEQLLRGGGIASKGDSPMAGGAAALVRLLLGRVPGLVCLVTSREPLHMDGEQEFPLAALSLPTGETTGETDMERLIGCSSVALFADRARLVRPDFALAPNNSEAVVTICRRLEGMPLAIEMAAAWSNTHTPARILERLGQQLDLLVSRRRDLPPRQQSLRATIEWSYNLLSEPERTLLGRLSVFVGGWTEEAAIAVCKDGPTGGGSSLEESHRFLSPAVVRNALAGLVDKSLVRYESIGRESQETEERYRLLETIREYAREKLAEASDIARVRERHQDYFLGFAEQAESYLRGSEQAVWLDRLESEADNLRAAMNGEWNEAEGALRGLRLTGALQRFWHVRGNIAEGRTHLRKALEREGAQGATPARAKALSGAGILAYEQSDYDSARALYRQGLAIHKELGNRMGAATALGNLGVLAAEQGDYWGARKPYEECLQIFQELGEQALVATVFYNLGNLATNQADYTSAWTLYQQSLTIRRGLGGREGVAWCLHSLGCVAGDQGDYAAGQALLEESLALFRESGNKHGIAALLQTLGGTAGEQGDPSKAQALLEESWTLYTELGGRRGAAETRNNQSRLAIDLGDYAGARALAEESLATFTELGHRRGVALSLRNLGLVDLRLGDYAAGLARFREALVIYREMVNRKGVLHSLEGMAAGFAASAEPEKAVYLWGTAETLRETLGVPVSPNEREIYDRQLAQARLALGESAFSAAWEAGHALTWEQAIVCALGETAP